MRTFTASVAFAAIVSQAEAFWGTAHVLLARRAQDILQASYPGTFSQALDELKPLQKYYSSLTSGEGSNPFTECATFADDIKGKGYSFQSDWHYINLPYLDDAGTTLDDFNFDQGTWNIVDALSDMTKFLKYEITASESIYMTKIASYFSYEEDQRSFALRMIVHYVGDVHQPLHSATKVDSQYTTGDRGGTSEHIPSKDGVSSLHFVWDSVLYEYTGRVSLPLTTSAWDWYTTEVASLVSQFPTDDSKINAGQFSEWAQEGLTLSETLVYPDFVDSTDPDQAYIDAAKPVLQSHIMYGGARLAALMVDIYGDSENSFAFLN